MVRFYVLGICVLFAIGMYVTLHSGLHPAVTGVMKPSFFDKPEEIGAVVFRRLYGSLGEAKSLVFGLAPDDESNPRILEGFLATARAEGRPFHVVLKEPEMPALKFTQDNEQEIEVVDLAFNQPDMATVVDAVRSHTAKGQRVLIYTVNLFSTHLIRGNPISRFEDATKEKAHSITAMALPLKATQEYLVQPSCVGSERDSRGTAPLGCAAMIKGRGLYRKKMDQSRYVALMDQQGLGDNDFLLYVAAPVADKPMR